ncbi:hypothetical protein B0H21DRAFT_885061 [Amylocystis lapponica]|nr:hypothetical protein B0H21DRAFT_885061 [Amylocystis lapponica]
MFLQCSASKLRTLHAVSSTAEFQWARNFQRYFVAESYMRQHCQPVRVKEMYNLQRSVPTTMFADLSSIPEDSTIIVQTIDGLLSAIHLSAPVPSSVQHPPHTRKDPDTSMAQHTSSPAHRPRRVRGRARARKTACAVKRTFSTCNTSSGGCTGSRTVPCCPCRRPARPRPPRRADSDDDMSGEDFVLREEEYEDWDECKDDEELERALDGVGTAALSSLEALREGAWLPLREEAREPHEGGTQQDDSDGKEKAKTQVDEMNGF